MSDPDLRQIRAFNRLVTQRIGVLQASYLGQGRPFGEARVLFEVGRDGADVRDLRQRLELDSGYLSRLLRALERQELVVVEKSAADGRARLARLTDRGQAEVDAYDVQSNRLAQSLIDPLDERQRRRLVEAMGEVERLLRASAVAVEVVSPGSADARWCLDRYFAELAQRFDSGYDPAQAAPAPEDQFAPPKGWFVVARLEGRPVACGALKRVDAETGEIKRLWTDPTSRGLGLGRKVLTTLEALGCEAGLRRVRLDSNAALTEAIGLYAKAGYEEVERFNDDPYAQMWFGKALG
ncbi:MULTISPECIES: helix-turn-helix domain-containing GNAT family N-acetyltransferase [unclassified Caulobacter]|uniref:bifunctional helix-turn-helix transcriptional regulator/GNAT family N-acetyltransferase n=1 Tax=unclassified Caulobacter TaxID=2648921 RepID=UPI0006F54CED|nr:MULTISPECIES: helix-turn-helix domain-containing GNAT family N-acetyltransferase [unclassified Caulobacter]KQV55089.1 MarR family transcriptional regulator [Caulobacter sp. Root342]KQV63724.1 MarR family transcriptional regulator [Caulobacter sp. Root343]